MRSLWVGLGLSLVITAVVVLVIDGSLVPVGVLLVGGGFMMLYGAIWGHER